MLLSDLKPWIPYLELRASCSPCYCMPLWLGSCLLTMWYLCAVIFMPLLGTWALSLSWPLASNTRACWITTGTDWINGLVSTSALFCLHDNSLSFETLPSDFQILSVNRSLTGMLRIPRGSGGELSFSQLLSVSRSNFSNFRFSLSVRPPELNIVSFKDEGRAQDSRRKQARMLHRVTRHKQQAVHMLILSNV